MARNKIIINGETYIDLTADTVTAADVAEGKTFHLANGVIAEGTSTKDSDTTDANAQVAEVLSGKTFYARGSKMTGTMVNNGAVSGVISTKAQQYTVPIGYHDGSGKVQISSTEQAKIIAGNIKAGVEILGVTGNYAGEAVSVQSKAAASGFTAQTILPDSGYDYLSQVTIAPISIVETDNAAGGKTVTVSAGVI